MGLLASSIGSRLAHTADITTGVREEIYSLILAVLSLQASPKIVTQLCVRHLLVSRTSQYPGLPQCAHAYACIA